MGRHKAYGSNPRKRRRIRFVPQWLEKHGAADGATQATPNSINDPEALQDLIHCAVDGNIIAVRLLARSGVNVNMVDEKGWTALHYAANEAQQDIVKVLMGDCGADGSIRTPKGLTAADLAERREHREPQASSTPSSSSSPSNKLSSASSSSQASGRC